MKPESSKAINQRLRAIPAVGEVLGWDRVISLLDSLPRWAVIQAIQEALAQERSRIIEAWSDRAEPQVPDRSSMESLIREKAQAIARPSLRRVINATGVVLHTNLGRALLSREAVDALKDAACGYTDLEMDLGTGRRSSRYVHIRSLLCEICCAEGALVVNNNAGAVLLALSTIAQEMEVVVSRGELVEIGGSFRIPDIMLASGCRLVEVGTTNKTRPGDYRIGVTDRTGLLLKVHPSNYRIVGFTEETGLEELVSLGTEHGIPVMVDLGSGSLVDFRSRGLSHEPTVEEVLKTGADIVTFSGDKLLGGPQAGIIVGKASFIERMERNPLTRALRIDKFSLSALESTLRLYRDRESVWEKVPTLRMITISSSECKKRALALARRLRRIEEGKFPCEIREGVSRVGGGAFPLEDLPTYLVSIRPTGVSPYELYRELLASDPPVITRLEDDALVLDVRTIQESEYRQLIEVFQRLPLSSHAKQPV